MAIRTAIKAALLSLETEQPRLPFEEPGLFVPARPAPPAPAIILERAPDALPAEAEPPAQIKESASTSWRARAAEIRALAATLPQESTSHVIGKIAGLYEELAMEAARSEEAAQREQAAPPLDGPRLEEEPPPAPPASARPRPARPATYPRRPPPSDRGHARR